jgi:hypothetical protein
MDIDEQIRGIFERHGGEMTIHQLARHCLEEADLAVSYEACERILSATDAQGQPYAELSTEPTSVGERIWRKRRRET